MGQALSDRWTVKNKAEPLGNIVLKRDTRMRLLFCQMQYDGFLNRKC